MAKIRQEQDLTLTTDCHFDFFDRLKILCGCTLRLTAKVTIPTTVDSYNGATKISFVSKSKSAMRQDLPGYGYAPEPTNQKNKSGL